LTVWGFEERFQDLPKDPGLTTSAESLPQEAVRNGVTVIRRLSSSANGATGVIKDARWVMDAAEYAHETLYANRSLIGPEKH